jgi:hypothetical protein
LDIRFQEAQVSEDKKSNGWEQFAFANSYVPNSYKASVALFVYKASFSVWR